MGCRNKKPPVSASALSQMGVCERLVVFEHREGRRLTTAQKVALRRGLQAHQRFASEDLPQAARIGRRSLATQDFGEGHILPCCMDRVPRPLLLGWSSVLGSLKLAPAACRLLEHWSVLKGAARSVLRPIAWLVSRIVGAREDGHVD